MEGKVTKEKGVWRVLMFKKGKNMLLKIILYEKKDSLLMMEKLDSRRETTGFLLYKFPM